MRNKSRKLFTLFLTVVMLLTMVPFAPVTSAKELQPGQSMTEAVVTEDTEDGNFTVTKYCTTTRSAENPEDYTYVYFAEIVKYIGSSSEVTVPDAIDGKYKVTAIAEGAFADRAKTEETPALKITKVVLPETVKTIESNAFSACKNLTTLIIPEGDVVFYSDSFPVFTTSDGLFTYNRFARRVWGAEYTDTYCIRIVKYLGNEENVTIPEVFDSLDGYLVTDIGDSAFAEKTELKKVVFPDTVRCIETRAFDSCTSLNEFTLPSSLEIIDSYAFFGCSSLTYLNLSAGLKVIGDSAFEGCSSFVGNTRVVTDPESDGYIALYLPEGLEEIGAQAFTDCQSLLRVIVPEGITEIKTGTFTNCKALEYVELPESIETVGVAFNGAFSERDFRSVEYATLIIKAPHCEILESPEMSKSVVFYGVKYGAVNAFVDMLNKREADELKSHGEIYGQHGDPYVRGFVAIENDKHVFSGKITYATCTTGGYTTYLCSCGNKTEYVCEYIDALGHAYGEYETQSEPTCLAIGSKCHICQRALLDENGEETGEICGHKEYVQIPALGHEWVAKATATCTQNGASFKECDRCGVKTDVKTLLALGHQMDFKNTTEGTYFFVERKSTPCPETPAEGETSGKTTDKDKGTKAQSGSLLSDILALLLGGSAETEPDERDLLEPVGKIEFVADLHNGTTRKLIIGEDDGVYVYKCMFPECDHVEVAVVSAHPDTDNDHYCDYCDRPVGTSDTSYGTSCTCSCHKQVGISALFYKIKLIFWKLFGTNKVCECGAIHY